MSIDIYYIYYMSISNQWIHVICCIKFVSDLLVQVAEAFSQVHFPLLPHGQAPAQVWPHSFYAAD